jgi:hypothetical protein
LPSDCRALLARPAGRRPAAGRRYGCNRVGRWGGCPPRPQGRPKRPEGELSPVCLFRVMPVTPFRLKTVRSPRPRLPGPLPLRHHPIGRPPEHRAPLQRAQPGARAWWGTPWTGSGPARRHLGGRTAAGPRGPCPAGGVAGPRHRAADRGRAGGHPRVHPAVGAVRRLGVVGDGRPAVGSGGQRAVARAAAEEGR